MVLGLLWYVTELQWLASLIVTLIITWLYFGELPTRNALIAMFFLMGAILAIYWK